MRMQTGNLLQRRTGSAGALVTGAAMVPGMFPGRGAAGSILRRWTGSAGALLAGAAIVTGALCRNFLRCVRVHRHWLLPLLLQ